MNTAEFRFFEPLRVRWAEVDMQKIVFNGHYLMYFDTAVAGYWRAAAMPYHETMAQLSGDLYVRKATLEYLGSARYDERLRVGVRCGRIGTSSMLFTAAVFRAEQALVHGELVYVFADPASQTSQPVPPLLREALTGFEAGQAMFDVRLGTWTQHGTQIMALRQAVFGQEQGGAAALMGDPADATALHALAINRFGMSVACGRLFAASVGVSQLDYLATHAGVRGAGIGTAVLQALLQAAMARGDQAVLLHAQLSARGLYERAGFVAEGPVFEAAGLMHQAMRKRF
jgi:YbgC/YbaW family acyl-CoA thioester hydrolase